MIDNNFRPQYIIKVPDKNEYSDDIINCMKESG